MEIIALLIEIFPTVGFPVICCGLLGWFVFKIYQDTTKQNTENMEKLQNRCLEREDKLYKQLEEQNKINGQFAQIIAQYEITLDEIKEDVKDIKEDITVIRNTH